MYPYLLNDKWKISFFFIFFFLDKKETKNQDCSSFTSKLLFFKINAIQTISKLSFCHLNSIPSSKFYGLLTTCKIKLQTNNFEKVCFVA